MVVKAVEDGVVTAVDGARIAVGEREYRLKKFSGLNEHTCLNQKPVVKLGDKVKRGQIIADGAATCQGELALGKNILVAFMSWRGFNFEEAIVVSERLVSEGKYTSIHIEELQAELRETRLGREEFTRDIPNVSEESLSNLDEIGIVRIGA
jgi:DNA-directed RNA polymerase subunit beta